MEDGRNFLFIAIIIQKIDDLSVYFVFWAMEIGGWRRQHRLWFQILQRHSWFKLGDARRTQPWRVIDLNKYKVYKTMCTERAASTQTLPATINQRNICATSSPVTEVVSFFAISGVVVLVFSMYVWWWRAEHGQYWDYAFWWSRGCVWSIYLPNQKRKRLWRPWNVAIYETLIW